MVEAKFDRSSHQHGIRFYYRLIGLQSWLESRDDHMYGSTWRRGQ